MRRVAVRVVPLVGEPWGAGALVAEGFWERLRGLGAAAVRGTGAWLLFPGCASLHTWGMGTAVDAAFLDAGGRVVSSARAVGPGRVLGARGAGLALERVADAGPWPAPGDRVEIETTNGGREAPGRRELP